MNILPAWANFPVTIGAIAIGLVFLLRQWRELRGLTLCGPWWWCVVVLMAIAGVETLVAWAPGFGDSAVSEPLRFMALTGLFMPLMSLMGAKRPQHNAWHFIVISLWGILALPALETLFLQRGQALEMYDARGWFLLALVIISALNLGLVRWWPSALLIAAAEVLMLAAYLPGVRVSVVAQWEPTGRIAWGCILLATALAVMQWQRHRQRASSVPAWDRLWLDFRDGFGALWAIRIAEQINQVAEQQQWSFRVKWGGFRSTGSGEPLTQSPFEQRPALGQVVENLFRRFVDRPWMEARLGRSLDDLKARRG